MTEKKNTLGEVIQEALKRAAETQGTEGTDKCGCMHCSGNAVKTTMLKTDNITISLTVGVNTDGEDEMELGMSLPEQDTVLLKVSGDDATDEFRSAMQELFA